MQPHVEIGDDGKVYRHKVTKSRCGKNAYTSRKLALSAAAIARKTTGEDIRAYKCPYGCHAWHQGHPAGMDRETYKAWGVAS